MICEHCHGEGFMSLGPDLIPCPECFGSGIASCCDAAGSNAQAAYRDDKFEPALCHHCGAEYRGPALYCSLRCALADA
jgi:hypothetical protein